jgi:hypothetical protein
VKSTPLVAAVLIAACSSTPATPSNVEPALTDRDYPAMAWVPADASLAVSAAQLEDLVKLLREGADVVLMLPGYRARDIDAWMRGRFGVSALVIDDLAAAGINTGGSVAAFVRGRGLTFALPIADRGRVVDMLDRHIPAIDSEPFTRGGFEGRTWSDGEMSVGYAAADEWALVHVALGASAPSLGWLDEILAVRGRGLGAEMVFARAKARAAAIGEEAARRYGWPAPERPDVAGVIRPAQLAADFAAAEPCLIGAASVAPTVLVGADVEWDRISGFFELELTDAAAAVLAADRPPPPASGMIEVAGAAPMAGLWTIPAKVIERARVAWACPELGSPVDTSALRGATSVAAAAWVLDPDRPRQTRGVVRVTGLDPSVLRSLLDQIPGRSLLERGRTVGGVKLTVLGGRLGIPEIGYRISRAETAVGIDAARVAASLAGRAAASVPLIHIRLAPAKIANLPSLLAEATASVGAGRSLGSRLGERLRRYQWGELTLAQRGPVVRLTAAMQLAGK